MSKICFVSYEIFPTTKGGVGVFLNNIAHQLLSSGHEVIFLLDIPENEFFQFQKEDRLKFPNSEKCIAYWIEDLCKDIGLNQADFISIYAWKSYRFHFACEKIYNVDHPKIIEFFDYCGSAYHALSAKIAGLTYQDTQLIIRLHTSIEVMAQFDSTSTMNLGEYSIYALEHQSLRFADAILYPSKSFLEKMYLPIYQETWWGQQIYAKPPVLHSPTPVHYQADCYIILFYGRLYSIKGVDQFIDAAIEFIKLINSPIYKFYLVGYDSYRTPLGDGSSYQEYLLNKIPPDLRNSFVFTGQISWEKLSSLLPKVRFAVFPSLYESFCYAAHELAAAGIPLLLSDIPTFRDHFSSGEKALFYDGTLGDLISKMILINQNDSLRFSLSKPYLPKEDVLPTVYNNKFTNWMNIIPNNTIFRLTICILTDGVSNEGTKSTIRSIRKSNLSNIDVFQVSSSELDRTSSAPWTAFLGQLCGFFDEESHPIDPFSIKNGNALLILRAGDDLDCEYINSSIKVMVRYTEISFVGSWKATWSECPNSIDTVPLDALPELLPFHGVQLPLRCFLRTRPEGGLIDLFNPSAGEWGEIDYLWKLDRIDQCGIIIPRTYIHLKQFEYKVAPPNLLLYLVNRDQQTFHKIRLARWHINNCDQRILIKDGDYNDLKGTIEYRLIMGARNKRLHFYSYMEKRGSIGHIFLRGLRSCLNKIRTDIKAIHDRFI